MPYYTSTNSSSNPPLEESFKKLVNSKSPSIFNNNEKTFIEECEIPTINLKNLTSDSSQERKTCMKQLAKAAKEWGIFHVLDHGISSKLLRVVRREQVRLFEMEFKKKDLCGLYKWGTPSARCPKQFSWSEAFHVPLGEINKICKNEELSNLREVMDRLGSDLSSLASTIAGALSEFLVKPGGQSVTKSCSKNTSFLRLNHYPKCAYSQETFGLVPHTDSCFLTIVHSNNVGRIEFIKDSKWLSVKPKPNALIVNIGDLFQAWSNDIYKSIEHRVMIQNKVERHSMAYFLCPSYQSTIGSCTTGTGFPSVYSDFTFGEFRAQVEKDVKQLGCKVGLSRFRV